jgi:hypothetical protein
MTIESYFQDVIMPALATLDTKIEELENSDWPGAVFAKADMEEVRLETMRAFGLSIQSIWERQLRSYLLGCAKDLRPGEPFATKIEKANWKELQKLFRGLRGIGLDAFPSFSVLDALQHLGNACRHGDGDSAAELARRSQFGADELAQMFDAPRLARNFPTQPIDAKRLAQFQWLVIEETLAVNGGAEARAAPFMYMAMNRDFGEIDPHLGRFPPPVEAALFFLLLAP